MFSQTIIIGTLGSDPELKYTKSGAAVCNFSVAVTERWRDKKTQEKRENTVWHKVNVWNAQAESCNTYLAKGRQVMVVGNVSARAYLNNKGEAAASLDLRAREVKFLGGSQGGGRSGGGNRGGQQQQQQQQKKYNVPTDSGNVDSTDIPF